jgi:DNA-binding response OmpR family regulator
MEDSGGGKKVILIMDDEPAICGICQRVLADEGFEVDVAANGKVAQPMITGKHYSLFLFDVRTPEMNGMELYRWLEENHPRLAGRVIFTTGSVVGQSTTAFVEHASRPFLPKPFTPDELKDIVARTLREVEK